MNRNHLELAKLVAQWLQALRGGVQNARLHRPHVTDAEKAVADAVAKYLQVLAAEMLLAAGEVTQ